MDKFIIEGGTPLNGEVVPAGNKNAALPLVAACLLTEEPVVLRNVPRRQAKCAGALPQLSTAARSTPGAALLQCRAGWASRQPGEQQRHPRQKTTFGRDVFLKNFWRTPNQPLPQAAGSSTQTLSPLTLMVLQPTRAHIAASSPAA